MFCIEERACFKTATKILKSVNVAAQNLKVNISGYFLFVKNSK